MTGRLFDILESAWTNLGVARRERYGIWRWRLERKLETERMKEKAGSEQVPFRVSFLAHLVDHGMGHFMLPFSLSVAFAKEGSMSLPPLILGMVIAVGLITAISYFFAPEAVKVKEAREYQQIGFWGVVVKSIFGAVSQLPIMLIFVLTIYLSINL